MSGPNDAVRPSRPALRVSFELLVVAMNAIGTLLIFIIMVMICGDILMRYLFDAPINGVTKMTELFIVVIVFLQLPHATRLGKLTRSDAAWLAIMRRWPWLAHSLSLFYDLAGCVLLSVVAHGAWPKFVKSWEGDFFVGNVGVFTFPEWPTWAVLIFGATVIAIQFALLALRHLRDAIANRPETPAAGVH
jgi:TRAP-type mannitol/chloroaromatic compound transport system permease small subunit